MAQRPQIIRGLLFSACSLGLIATLVLGILVYTAIHDRGRTFADLLTEPGARAHPRGAHLFEAGQSDCAFRAPCRNELRLYWGSVLPPAETLDETAAELQALGYAPMEATVSGLCRHAPETRQLRRGGVTVRLHAHPTPYRLVRGVHVNALQFASALAVVADNFSTDDEAELRAEGKCQP